MLIPIYSSSGDFSDRLYDTADCIVTSNNLVSMSVPIFFIVEEDKTTKSY